MTLYATAGELECLFTLVKMLEGGECVGEREDDARRVGLFSRSDMVVKSMIQVRPNVSEVMRKVILRILRT